MTTLRRTALGVVGMMVAAAAVGSLVAAGPAYAANNVAVSVDSPGGAFNPGDAQVLTIQVENRSKVDGAAIQLSVSGLNDFTLSDPRGCVGSANSCVVSGVDGGAKKTVSFTIRATGSVDPGQQKTDHGTATASLGGDSDSADFSATIKGGQPTQAPSVAQVTGQVRDQTTGNPVKGAVVVLVDSGACAANRDPCQTGTDNQGNFKFASRPDKPITPGTIQVGASKTGFANGVTTVDARAGQSVTVTIKLKPTADATASATTDPLPTQDTQGPTADTVTQGPAAAGAQKPASNSGPSTVSWIILVLAGLLVLLGVGVFVVLFVNRKKGDADDDEGDGDPNGPQGTPPPGGGVYGAGPAGSPTMVGGSGMTQTVMAGGPGGDAATTILHPQRPEDEFPDPYAAPYPAGPGGYPPAGAGYGAGGGYGNGAGYGGSATQVGGYPPPAAGHPNGGYDPQTQPYGAAPAGYGPGGARGGGYDQGGGYPAPAGYDQQGGGYGAAPAAPQRYDDATRHWDAAGAGAPAGYSDQGHGDQGAGHAGHPAQPAQPGGYPGGAYEQQQPGYGYGQPADPYEAYAPDQGGPGYQDPYYQPQPSETPGPRRGAPSPGRGRGDQRLDWLDD